MRKALVVALVALLATPALASHKLWGGFSWPHHHHPQVRVINIHDEFVRNFPPGPKRRRWNLIRQRVIRDYERSGVLAFRVRIRAGTTCSLNKDSPNWYGNQPQPPKGTIRICRRMSPGGFATVARSSEQAQWAIAAVNRRGHLRGVLCHELGHALGLDHRYDDHNRGQSCMTNIMQFYRPDAHDLDLIRELNT